MGYIQFSETIDCLTQSEKEWVKTRLSTVDASEFLWELNGDRLWIHSKFGNPLKVVEFAREFLKKFRPEDSFSITWACFEDDPRGEFEGGGAFVTARSTKLFFPKNKVEEEQDKFVSKRKGK